MGCRRADIFCMRILGMYVSIRRRATTYRLLDSPSLQTVTVLLETHNGPPLNTTVTKRDGERNGQGFLHLNSGHNNKHEY